MAFRPSSSTRKRQLVRSSKGKNDMSMDLLLLQQVEVNDDSTTSLSSTVTRDNETPKSTGPPEHETNKPQHEQKKPRKSVRFDNNANQVHEMSAQHDHKTRLELYQSEDEPSTWYTHAELQKIRDQLGPDVQEFLAQHSWCQRIVTRVYQECHDVASQQQKQEEAESAVFPLLRRKLEQVYGLMSSARDWWWEWNAFLWEVWCCKTPKQNNGMSYNHKNQAAGHLVATS